jgi:hypothetical protein
MWFVLYGPDAQSSVAAFGKMPAKAMKAFDKAWVKLKPPKGGTPPAPKAKTRPSRLERLPGSLGRCCLSRSRGGCT